jgi:hypothetical protein
VTVELHDDITMTSSMECVKVTATSDHRPVDAMPVMRPTRGSRRSR